MGDYNIKDKVIDVNTAKPGIYYFVDTCFNTISKIDFIRSYTKTVTTDWDDHAVFKYIKYYNHYFHESVDTAIKKEDSIKWNGSCNFLLPTLDDAIEFLVNDFHDWADNKREQLENEIKENAEKLEKHLDKCNEDTIKFM